MKTSFLALWSPFWTSVFLLGCSFLLMAVDTVSADPFDELRSYSLFKTITPASVTPGSILTQRLGSMSFRRGVSVQSCFLTEIPMARTLDLLATWNPSAHPSLKVLHHESIQLPLSPGAFSDLEVSNNDRTGRWLIDQSSSSDLLSTLYLSKRESEQKPNVKDANETSRFWKSVMGDRANSFFRGGLTSLPAYDYSDKSYTSDQELRSLLNEMPPIASRYHDFLAQTVFSTNPGNSPYSPHAYWEALSVQDEETLNLGVIFTKPGTQSSIAVDCQYYANVSYFVDVMIYELWPVKIEGHDETLVWRCDMVSSPNLAEYRGIERLAAENLTLQSVKQAIRSFQEDARKTK